MVCPAEKVANIISELALVRLCGQGLRSRSCGLW